MDRYFDHRLDYRVNQAHEEYEEYLEGVAESVIGDRQEEIEEIESEFEKIREEIKDKLKDIEDRRESLWQALKDDLEEASATLDPPEIPEAEVAEETIEALFSSERDYGEQIVHYKRFQGKVATP